MNWPIIEQSGPRSQHKCQNRAAGPTLFSTPVIQRAPDPPPPSMTRAEEIRRSFTSPGEITFASPNPPTLSLYNFAIGQPTLKKEHLAALKAIPILFKRFSLRQVTASSAAGHADSTDEDRVNDPLSVNRAWRCKKSCSPPWGCRSPVLGFGERLPIADQ